MTRPSDERIAASLGALRADADLWQSMAATVTEAGRAAAALGPRAGDFSAPGAELAETYARLRSKMVRLLDEASVNFAGVASALRTSADSYQAEEEAGVHRLRGIY